MFLIFLLKNDFLIFSMNELLAGEISETLGLLLFGISLIAATAGIRKIFGFNKKAEPDGKSLEDLAEKPEN